MNLFKLFNRGIEFVLLVLLASLPTNTFATTKGTLVIATGDVRGLYFSFATELCRNINRQRKQLGFRCVIEATDGSVQNVELLTSDQADFALIQSDVLTAAVRQNGEIFGLRPLFPEALHIFSRSSSDIKQFSDIEGKVLGVPGIDSGSSVLVDYVLELSGVTPGEITYGQSFHELILRFCTRQIDTVMYVAGANNEFFREIISRCDAQTVGLSPDLIAKLVAQKNTLARATIKQKINSEVEVQTVGPTAWLAVSDKLQSETIDVFLKAIDENSDLLGRAHPTFRTLLKFQHHEGITNEALHPFVKLD